MSLEYCNECKEDSIKVKAYTREDGVKCRTSYCSNVGCGYRKDLPFSRVSVQIGGNSNVKSK